MSPLLICAIVAGIILALIVLGVLLYFSALPKFILHKIRTSPNPDGEMTFPENYDEMKSKCEIVKDLVYPSQYPSNAYNIYLPSKAEEKIPLIIWVHGGGFIGGTKDGGENVMVALCSAGYAVASIDYAVAPEHKYPTAVRQVSEFVSNLPELFKKYPVIDENKIIFGGDSAGAQIAAQYVTTQTNPGFAEEMHIPVLLNEKIKAIVLICGPFNLPAIRTYAQKTNKMFRRLVDIWGRVYFGKLFWYKNAAARQTVIAEHLTKDFPPTFLTDGNKGSFEAQNRKLALSLKELNVPVEEVYFDLEKGEVPHEFLFHLHEQNSLYCMEKILDFLHRI